MVTLEITRTAMYLAYLMQALRTPEATPILVARRKRQSQFVFGSVAEMEIALAF